MPARYPVRAAHSATLATTQSVLFAWRSAPKLQTTLGMICKSLTETNAPEKARLSGSDACSGWPLPATGGGTGAAVLALLYAKKLAAALGKPVIVENKPGAATMLAANYVANA